MLSSQGSWDLGVWVFFFNWQILKAMFGLWNLTLVIRTSSFTGSKGSISYDLFRNTSVSHRWQ